ncbi:MAG: hypothetical protein M1299_08710 [Firmicutes bacterium]|nr:hypothetical protein [Bacillota bacterium]
MAILLLIVTVMALLAVGCGQSQTAEKGKPEQAQPQPSEKPKESTEKPKESAAQVVTLSSSDQPQGCASCHVKNGDKDYTLAAEVKKIQNHPTVPADATVKTCIACHSEKSPKPFKWVLHKVHLESKIYGSKYDSACVTCHKLTSTGLLTVKGLEADGTKFTDIKSTNEDKAPQGCASCHVKKGDKDYTLAAEVKKIQNHPTVSPNATVKTCIACHSEKSPKPFKQVLHLVHLQGKIYPQNYLNSCVNCHIQTPTGEMKVKGL